MGKLFSVAVLAGFFSCVVNALEFEPIADVQRGSAGVYNINVHADDPRIHDDLSALALVKAAYDGALQSGPGKVRKENGIYTLPSGGAHIPFLVRAPDGEIFCITGLLMGGLFSLPEQRPFCRARQSKAVGELPWGFVASEAADPMTFLQGKVLSTQASWSKFTPIKTSATISPTRKIRPCSGSRPFASLIIPLISRRGSVGTERTHIARFPSPADGGDLICDVDVIDGQDPRDLPPEGIILYLKPWTETVAALFTPSASLPGEAAGGLDHSGAQLDDSRFLSGASSVGEGRENDAVLMGGDATLSQLSTASSLLMDEGDLNQGGSALGSFQQFSVTSEPQPIFSIQDETGERPGIGSLRKDLFGAKDSKLSDDWVLVGEEGGSSAASAAPPGTILSIGPDPELRPGAKERVAWQMVRLFSPETFSSPASPLHSPVTSRSTDRAQKIDTLMAELLGVDVGTAIALRRKYSTGNQLSPIKEPPLQHASELSFAPEEIPANIRVAAGHLMILGKERILDEAKVLESLYPIRMGQAIAILVAAYESDDLLFYKHLVELLTGRFGRDNYIAVAANLISEFKMPPKNALDLSKSAFDYQEALEVFEGYPSCTPLDLLESAGIAFPVGTTEGAEEVPLEPIAPPTKAFNPLEPGDMVEKVSRLKAEWVPSPRDAKETYELSSNGRLAYYIAETLQAEDNVPFLQGLALAYSKDHDTDETAEDHNLYRDAVHQACALAKHYGQVRVSHEAEELGGVSHVARELIIGFVKNVFSLREDIAVHMVDEYSPNAPQEYAKERQDAPDAWEATKVLPELQFAMKELRILNRALHSAQTGESKEPMVESLVWVFTRIFHCTMFETMRSSFAPGYA